MICLRRIKQDYYYSLAVKVRNFFQVINSGHVILLKSVL